MNKVIITHKGVMVNPASAPLLPDEVANSLKKRMADPEKGEAPSGELEASGTDQPTPEKAIEARLSRSTARPSKSLRLFALSWHCAPIP